MNQFEQQLAVIVQRWINKTGTVEAVFAQYVTEAVTALNHSLTAIKQIPPTAFIKKMNKKCSETKSVLGSFSSILRDHSILLSRFEQEVMRTEDTPKFISRDQTEPAVDRILEKLIHGSMGICTEAGELQDAIKKHLMYGRPLDTTNVMEECFDVLWYVILCLSACGFTLEQAMARGVAKLRSRYPDGFTRDSANNRNLQDERSALEDLPEHEYKK